jgi:predicted CXXCH cytochrome family protein
MFLLVLATLLASILALFSAQTPQQTRSAQFVGSKACESCHKTTYDRWAKTRMANIVVDPKVRPDAILADFSTPNPVVTFKKEDIAFTYGSRWKQRYFTKVGNDYFPLPAQWDVTNRTWSRYHVENGTDWWTKYYPDENTKRPTGPLCDGCHSVNYNIATKQPTEWNVGCERCHGAGGDHVQAPSKQNIVNPARLDYVRGNDVCIQCHSQGQPLTKPLNGVYYDWPVGYQPGARLSDYWELEEHKLGEETFTHFPEGSAHKNRMQGNDFVTSVMYRRGVSCWSCHDVHGTGNPGEVIRTGNDLCLSCHGQSSPAGPRGSLEEHTHHASTSAGSQCMACHEPKIARQIANVYVRSHTFKFITPAETEQYKIPNACVSCHTDKTNAWATAELLKWPNISPWRVGK